MVNASTVQFRAGNVPRLVEKMLAETGLPASRLELGVAETGIMHDINGSADGLAALHHQGVSNLRRAPLNRNRIDRSFVKHVTASVNAAVAAATIVKLVHSLRVQVVAKGVETRAQADFGQQTGYACVQDYFYGEPMTVEMMTVEMTEDVMLRQRDSGPMLLALSG